MTPEMSDLVSGVTTAAGAVSKALESLDDRLTSVLLRVQALEDAAKSAPAQQFLSYLRSF